MIDDSPWNIRKLNKNHVPCLIFDRPYNQTVKESKYVTRVNNWQEIYDIITTGTVINSSNVNDSSDKINVDENIKKNAGVNRPTKNVNIKRNTNKNVSLINRRKEDKKTFIKDTRKNRSTTFNPHKFKTTNMRNTYGNCASNNYVDNNCVDNYADNFYNTYAHPSNTYFNSYPQSYWNNWNPILADINNVEGYIDDDKGRED